MMDIPSFLKKIFFPRKAAHEKIMNELIAEREMTEKIALTDDALMGREEMFPEAVKAARFNGLGKNVNITDLEEFFIMDAENAIKTLNGLYANIAALSDDEMETYIITVHGMKTALLNIGEEALSQVALKLEKYGEERDLNALAVETPAFVGTLEQLAAKLKPGEDDGPSKKP
jgi:HPt (histidine-containing phosphotransfer) domain-containing protein